MVESNKRAGQAGEDTRDRNPVTPEKAPQGGRADGQSPSREDQGRGQTGKPNENLGTESHRKGTDVDAATPVRDEHGAGGMKHDASTDSTRAGSGGGNARPQADSNAAGTDRAHADKGNTGGTTAAKR